MTRQRQFCARCQCSKLCCSVQRKHFLEVVSFFFLFRLFKFSKKMRIYYKLNEKMRKRSQVNIVKVNVIIKSLTTFILPTTTTTTICHTSFCTFLAVTACANVRTPHAHTATHHM